jgi:5'-methylthioadenosine phosphorylase
MVTDYDCWHPDHGHVTVDAVIKVLIDNAARARALVKAVAPLLRGRDTACHAGCHTALDAAIVTQPPARDPALVKRLDAVAGRVLSRN